MTNPKKRTSRTKAAATTKRLSEAQLDAMIEEATVVCYDDSEACTGFFTMFEEYLPLPFTTRVLGLEVSVESIDINEAEELVAVCERGGKRQRISLVDLPLPEPRPRGCEWIDAYRRWTQGR